MTKQGQLDQLEMLLESIKTIEHSSKDHNQKLYEIKLRLIRDIMEIEEELGIGM